LTFFFPLNLDFVLGLIWAYKILFLDVLFPLDVPRILFIDADQVVRADVKELWDQNLHNRVYGFTPFCNSNEATAGFRFWEQGTRFSDINICHMTIQIYD